MKINKIYNESCLDTMSRMPDNFIDLTVTSPPYDNLRTYNNDIDKTWGEHIWKPILQELYRVTKEGGVVVWVVGDATINFCETGTSFKQALYAMECGFNLLDTMVYYKQNYAPAYPSLRRYANQFEYMFIFSNGKPLSFNAIQTNKRRVREEVVGFRQKDGSVKRKENNCKRDTKDVSNVWSIFAAGGANDKLASKHPAVFPEKLAHDHIASWSNEGDLVYDPFMGSGTTAKMAKFTNRNYIGSEISEEYVKLAEKRINQMPETLF
jgi:DNA modification methylase